MNVKFYMYFNGERIRTLYDFRENFIAEDVLDAYSNGQLEKWLEAWRHNTELEQVRAITSTNAREILGELIRIFSCDDDESENIDAALSLYDCLEERKKFREYYIAHGMDEIESLRHELEEVKKERDELRKEIEKLRQENQNTKAHSSDIKRIDIPAGSIGLIRRVMGIWTNILPKIPPTRLGYRIADIGNCEDKLWIVDDTFGSTAGAIKISEAYSRKIRFNALAIQPANAYDEDEDLYFYYEVI